MGSTRIVLSLLLVCHAAAQAPAALDAQNLVWTTPSRDASGSMPFGNGRAGGNLWCGPDGTLRGYLSRTDSFSECSRLLKLGAFAVQVRRPEENEPFRQELCLREGCIRVVWGEGERRVALRIFVDSGDDVVHIVGEAARDEVLTVSASTWRQQARVLAGDELDSSWTMRRGPADVVVRESADRPVNAHAGTARMGFMHRNEDSVAAFTFARQALPAELAKAHDVLLHRMFGVLVDGDGLQRAHIRSALEPVWVTPRARQFAIRMAVPCVQDADADAFGRVAHELLDRADPIAAQRRTNAWWQQFWSRSWVFVGGAGDDAARCERLTQALALQRWVQACGGRGAFPIKFNGSMFTVEPRFTGGQPFDADWRRWGDCFWWQNTRLPYHPMLAQGDFEMMAPLFDFYRRTLPVAQARVASWHAPARGAYWPETMTPFGTHANADYGWERGDHPPGRVLCPWWEYVRVQGIELVALMLDHWDYRRDETFVREQLLPIAVPVLEWFATAYPRGDGGRLRITPTQSVETYWHGVEDDLPTVAGLHWVLRGLLGLPERLVEAATRDAWRALEGSLPPIPTREVDGVRLLAPAAKFDPKRSNCETPEMYAVFPFRLYGLGKPDLELARATFARRHDRFTNGWPQDGQDAVLLGLVDEARQNVLAKLQNSHRNHRFPVMWGPNFDWCPDQCHGSNLLDTVHRMLLQCDGARITVLPCWPREWDVQFRLHAPDRTTVEVQWRGGELRHLAVEPAARRADVVVGTAR